MPQVWVCAMCKKALGSGDNYVVTREKHDGFTELRVHVPCAEKG